ncbi:MAG: hypothetical protein AABY86_06485, partial [Bdellovibrionota bacterium]
NVARPDEDSHGEVWINGRAVDVQGEQKRFFVQLIGEEAAVPNILISMREASGKILGANFQLGRSSIEGPISLSYYTTNKTTMSDLLYEFTVAIQNPKGTYVKIDDQKVTEEQEKQLQEIRLILKEKQGQLTARLTQEGRLIRAINLPYRVSIQNYHSDDVYFSLIPPEGNLVGEMWNLPNHELQIKGLATPGIELEVNGNKVKVNGDGEFKFRFIPEKELSSINFRLQRPGSEAILLEKKYRCPRCGQTHKWYLPAYRKMGDHYIHLSLNGKTSLTLMDKNSMRREILSDSNVGLGYGHFIRYNYEWYIHAREYQSQKIDSSHRSSLNPSDHYSLDVRMYGTGFSWYPWSNCSIGLGVGMASTTYYPNEGASTEKYSFGLEMKASLRFSISERWEVTPSIHYLSAIMLHSDGFGMEFFSVMPIM